MLSVEYIYTMQCFNYDQIDHIGHEYIAVKGFQLLHSIGMLSLIISIHVQAYLSDNDYTLLVIIHYHDDIVDMWSF